MPSAKGLGKAARDFYNGYSAGASESKSNPAIGRVAQLVMESSRNAPAVSYSNRMVTSRARISSNRGKKGPTVITHRELINGSILGSTSFAVSNTYSLNPGIATTFPWLSTQASQYEEYRFRSLVFHYIPIAGTTTVGDVHLIPDYDPVNPPPLTETQAVDHVNSVSDSVWKSVTMRLDVKSMHSTGSRKYVRTSVVPSDLKTFDAGNFYICTNNEVNGTDKIGKMYVEYTVELYTPFIGPQPGSVSTTLTSYCSTIDQSLTTNVQEDLDLETQVANPLGITRSGASFVLPIGTWEISADITFLDSASEVFSGTVLITQGGASLTNYLGSSFSQSGGAAQSAHVHTQVIVTVTSSSSNLVAVHALAVGAAGTLSTTGKKSTVSFRVI